MSDFKCEKIYDAILGSKSENCYWRFTCGLHSNDKTFEKLELIKIHNKNIVECKTKKYSCCSIRRPNRWWW